MRSVRQEITKALTPFMGVRHLAIPFLKVYNYPSNDFVIDLDNIWKWLDFQQKYHAKTFLEKNFKLDLDYKIIAPEVTGAKKGRGGHNKETQPFRKRLNQNCRLWRPSSV
jgi:hypothetical protein